MFIDRVFQIETYKNTVNKYVLRKSDKALKHSNIQSFIKYCTLYNVIFW